MKKLISLAMSVAAAALIFTACGSDDEAAPASVTTTATISGIVTAPTDTMPEPQPIEGVQIHASINMGDVALNYDPAFDYENQTFTASTNANGEYTLEVTAGNRPVDVTIIGDDARLNVILSDSTSEMQTFRVNPSNLSVVGGQNVILDLEYN